MKPLIFRRLPWFCATAAALFNIGLSAFAEDWYRWRGPDLNGISRETEWLSQWPSQGPKQVWRVNVGIGFSSVSVSEGRVYTMGNRNDADTVYCLDAETGRGIWKHTYASPTDPRYYEGGSSITPTVDGKAVYALGRRGDLFCFDAPTGKIRWQKNIAAELGLAIPEWGFAGSPLVEGDLLILNAGRAGVAAHKNTGKVVWSTGKEASGYSSPVPFDQAGKRCVAIFAAKEIVAVDVKTGQIVWAHPWQTSYDVNAADPIIVGDKVFISSGYNRGCALLQIKDGRPSVVWENKHMKNQFNSSVLIDGYLYGIDGNTGRQDAFLNCVEFATGKLQWSEKGFGTGALMAADKKLIIQGDKGMLAIAEASPQSLKLMSRAQVLGGKCWTVPVLSNGRIYCRNAQGDLICLDLRKQ